MAGKNLAGYPALVLSDIRQILVTEYPIGYRRSCQIPDIQPDTGLAIRSDSWSSNYRRRNRCFITVALDPFYCIMIMLQILVSDQYHSLRIQNRVKQN